MFLVLLTATCFVAATISGLIGMAGGIFLLTVMLMMGMPVEQAIPLHAAIQLSSNGTRVWAFREHIRKPALKPFILVALPMPVLGLAIAGWLDEGVTKAVIGVLVLVAAWAPKGGLAQLKTTTAFSIAGALSGSLGVVVGATGPIIAPFMLRDGWANEEVIATKAAAQAFIHLQKLIAFGLAGYAMGDVLWQLPPLVVAVVAGTYCGKALLKHLSRDRFRKVYRVVLSLIAIRLLTSVLFG